MSPPSVRGDLSNPLVSVIVPAFNVQAYLAESLDSLLCQTYGNVEILVVNDASTDQSRSIADQRGRQDKRIRIVDHVVNSGISAARNTGISQAKGAFVALLDGDDVAHPDRIARQVAALLGDSSLGMVGSHVAVIDEDGRRTGRIWRRPTDPDSAGIGLIFRNTFSSVVLIRREAIPEGGYRKPMAEDYDFNVRLAACWRVTNLDEVLTDVRMRQSGLTGTKPELMASCVREIMADQLSAMGLNPTERQIQVNQYIGGRGLPTSRKLLDEIEAWLLALERTNEKCRRFNGLAFRRALGEEWFEVCLSATELGMFAVSRYRHSKLTRDWAPSLVSWLRFLTKASIHHKRVDMDRVQRPVKD